MQHHTLSFESFTIKRVKQVKNSCLIIDGNLMWEQHIYYISDKIQRNVEILKRMSGILPKKSVVMIHKTLIEPHFRYCIDVRGSCGVKLL